MAFAGGLLALLALALLPGLLVARAPWAAVPALSLAFWIVGAGWLALAARPAIPWSLVGAVWSLFAVAAGATLADVVKVNAYLRDMADFPTFNEVYKSFFTGSYPARTTVQSSITIPIEIDVVAVLPE